MILLNEVERELLSTKGRLLEKQMAELNKVAEKVKADFSSAMAMVVKNRPMRERPPVDAQLAYDEEQGALVWPIEEPVEVPAAPEPAEV